MDRERKGFINIGEILRVTTQLRGGALVCTVESQNHVKGNIRFFFFPLKWKREKKKKKEKEPEN